MPPGRTVSVTICKVRTGRMQSLRDVVATEEPLEIRVVRAEAGRPVASSVSVTMRTPGNDFELAAGFLFSEGILHSREEIAQISYCVDVPAEQQFNVVNVYLRPGIPFDDSRLRRNFYITSSCGICGKASLEALQVQGCRPFPADGPVVSEAVLFRLHDELRRAQALFRQTGGLHAAGLFTVDGTLIVLREDVGRHNAVDKVVGERLLAGKIPVRDALLMVSGRASFEIMQKAAVAGIPIVVAVGAPSSLAVDTAETFGMTLVGFLRTDAFNVYAGAGRIRLTPGPSPDCVAPASDRSAAVKPHQEKPG